MTPPRQQTRSGPRTASAPSSTAPTAPAAKAEDTGREPVPIQERLLNAPATGRGRRRAHHRRTTTGRFLHLLGPQWSQAVQRAPTLRQDAVAVQVSAPPLFARAQNVGRSAALLPVLHLGEHPAPGSEPGLRLEDLGVCADERRMWLVRLCDGIPVEPRVLNAIEFRANTQPIARFLCEITGSLTPLYTGFDWGAAGKLPFLPRLRHGRTIIVPARWRLPTADLPGQSAPWPQWEAAARAWLHTYRVPAGCT
ncbi:lantibiotic dehydratase [Kitasatospora sp. NPDC002040]|uniref:lantibiotic dehydratase n=1 Tax=Kitasatospora sp. NPDC002040 TaxID=3154661 RepID=UPI003319473E